MENKYSELCKFKYTALNTFTDPHLGNGKLYDCPKLVPVQACSKVYHLCLTHKCPGALDHTKCKFIFDCSEFYENETEWLAECERRVCLRRDNSNKYSYLGLFIVDLEECGVIDTNNPDFLFHEKIDFPYHRGPRGILENPHIKSYNDYMAWKIKKRL